MIMSQRNWNYNKKQVEFGAYVQSSYGNDPNNTNSPRSLDGIYLFPAPNLQSDHQIMDLRRVPFITRYKVVQIPITYVVINAVEGMAEEQVFESLKIYNKKRKKLFS